MEEYEAVKRKRSTVPNKPTNEMRPLFSRQTNIGRNNLSRRKLDKEWRIKQHEYKALETRKQKD